MREQGETLEIRGKRFAYTYNPQLLISSLFAYLFTSIYFLVRVKQIVITHFFSECVFLLLRGFQIRLLNEESKMKDSFSLYRGKNEGNGLKIKIVA